MSMYQPRRLWLTAGEPGNQAVGIVPRNHGTARSRSAVPHEDRPHLQDRKTPTMTQLAALLLLVLLALVVPLPVHAQCPPGTVAAPASFETIIQPALAVDTNPSADVVEVFLTAREAMVDYGIGNQTPAWTYNGVVPGPTIEAEVGNTLIVNFCNNLPDETTIHWHGIETPANMDGSNISSSACPPAAPSATSFRCW